MASFNSPRTFLWWPVAAWAGAAAYFLLPAEPPAAAVVLAAASGLLLARLLRDRPAPIAFGSLLLALALLGALAGKIAVERHEAPRLDRQRTVTVEGFVAAVEDRGARGYRLLIGAPSIEPLPRGRAPPAFVRITVRSGAVPKPGDGVRLRARLGPPSDPVWPGGWDFAFHAYFDRIGGIGFALGAAEPIDRPPPAGLADRAGLVIEDLRQDLSARIRAALPGDSGAIAAALLVGDRGAIGEAADEAMRVAGLSHVLSISGLHMSLVAIALFSGARLGMALVPPLALLLPAKKVAALVALAGIAAYTALSGFGIPAERAALMSAVVLVAVLLDRQALSLRTVAVAALVLIALSPQAALDAGAQMSFAAVAALVAGFEAWIARREAPLDAGDVDPLARLLHRLGGWVVAAALTSLIAGLATAPIAVHHFGRLAPYGLIANLAATPLVSLMVMPFGLLAMLAMPFGLEGPPLAVMGYGIDGMLAIATLVAEMTPGGGLIGRGNLAGTLLIVGGGLWLALWNRRIRLLGLPVIAIGLALLPLVSDPDLAVSGDGRAVLLRDDDGRRILVGRDRAFETSLWLQALGDPTDPKDPVLTATVRCDKEACVWRPGSGTAVPVAIVYDPIAFSDECPAARLVVTPLPAPEWCRTLTMVIDRGDLSGGGTRLYSLEGDWTHEPGRPALRPLAEAVRDGGRPWRGAPPD